MAKKKKTTTRPGYGFLAPLDEHGAPLDVVRLPAVITPDDPLGRVFEDGDPAYEVLVTYGGMELDLAGNGGERLCRAVVLGWSYLDNG